MEEIICHACGRPNLPEAKKCWYCQEVLEKPDEAGAKESASDAVNSSQPGSSDMNAEQPFRRVDGHSEPEGEIPEWLQRIRDLKEADHAQEDDEDRWQQQKLFSPAAAPAEDSPATGTPKRTARAATKTRHPADQHRKAAPPVSLPLENVNKKGEDAADPPEQENDLLDDLPDGFTPIKDNGSK